MVLKHNKVFKPELLKPSNSLSQYKNSRKIRPIHEFCGIFQILLYNMYIIAIFINIFIA